MSSKLKMDRVALATGNHWKLKEFARILGPLDIDVFVGPKFVSPDEVGHHYRTFAAIKARAGAKQFGVPCVGEASGIEVVGLDQLPGPFSADFGRFRHMDHRGLYEEIGYPQGVKRDEGNNQQLLELLQGKIGDDRIACYVAHLTVAAPDGEILWEDESTSWGWVLTAPQGQGGFGFDPIFSFFAFPGRSAAELTEDEKNLVSHRGEVTRKLIAWLSGQYA